MRNVDGNQRDVRFEILRGNGGRHRLVGLKFDDEIDFLFDQMLRVAQGDLRLVAVVDNDKLELLAFGSPQQTDMQSLRKYGIEFSDTETMEELRDKLATFYAKRTLTERPILPADCANAIIWLLSDQSAKTTGHVIPVDGGLPEAFLR